jgi:hypothetical protein
MAGVSPVAEIGVLVKELKWLCTKIEKASPVRDVMFIAYGMINTSSSVRSDIYYIPLLHSAPDGAWMNTSTSML